MTVEYLLPLFVGFFCSVAGIVSYKISRKFADVNNQRWANMYFLITVLSVLSIILWGVSFSLIAFALGEATGLVMTLIGLAFGIACSRKVTVVRTT